MQAAAMKGLEVQHDEEKHYQEGIHKEMAWQQNEESKAAKEINRRDKSTSWRKSTKVSPSAEVSEASTAYESKRMKSLLGGMSKNKLSALQLDLVQEEAEKMEMNPPGKSRSWALLSPNSSKRNFWDLLLIVALIFVASVTPFEVAFLSESGVALMVLNRAIDIIFGIDIILNFFTPFQTAHGIWVTNHRSIALNYMTSWFLIDLVSVMPFEMVKLVRLLRLAKLLRIFRASRMLKRWESRISIPFGVITLGKFVLYMVMLSHWLACIFRLVPAYEEGENSWMLAYFGDGAEELPPMEVYNAALYWATMTVTTIGYGDVVPKTDAERWVAIFAMMVGGSAYAYIVGSVCGLVASLGELEAILHRKIDDLNVFMEEKKLPNNLRISLREYFLYSAKKARNESYRALLQEMSPGMRGDIYYRTNSMWVAKIPFAHCASPFEKRMFITALSSKLQQVIYPPQERIIRPGGPAREMYIIERGVVMLNKSYFVPPDIDDSDDVQVVKLSSTLGAAEKQVLLRGNTFGDDFVLSHHRSRYHCTSLTYVELHVLTKSCLMEVFADECFPETWREFKKYVLKLAFRSKFVHIAKIVQAKRRQLERNHVKLTDEEEAKILHDVFKDLAARQL